MTDPNDMDDIIRRIIEGELDPRAIDWDFDIEEDEYIEDEDEEDIDDE